MFFCFKKSILKCVYVLNFIICVCLTGILSFAFIDIVILLYKVVRFFFYCCLYFKENLIDLVMVLGYFDQIFMFRNIMSGQNVGTMFVPIEMEGTTVEVLAQNSR